MEFSASHADGGTFEARGLRPFFAYRDLGIQDATDGAVVAHVIRAIPGAEFTGTRHHHEVTFQMIYCLRGWIEFDYEGIGPVRLLPGSCVHQPPGIRHTEIGHSDDLELLEIVMPGNFATVGD